MDWFVKGFIKASALWLAAGITLGVAIGIHPAWTVFRPVHLHLNLAGFVAMMIFGVAYHVIPRFAGVPLRDRRLAALHFWFANAGVALLVGGFAMRGAIAGAGGAFIGLGGALFAAGGYLFAWQMVRTIDAVPARAMRVGDAAASSPPVVSIARRPVVGGGTRGN